mmetsp:Transcript_10821/g.19267  ORF Transcript_10821/g.19267 Transcript_10821/m.19267 type:complete len:120 (-) Transcript_10821:266-625(-)
MGFMLTMFLNLWHIVTAEIMPGRTQISCSCTISSTPGCPVWSGPQKLQNGIWGISVCKGKNTWKQIQSVVQPYYSKLAVLFFTLQLCVSLLATLYVYAAQSIRQGKVRQIPSYIENENG